MLDDAVEGLPAVVVPGLPPGWERAWWQPTRTVLAVLVGLGGILPLLWMISTSLRPTTLPAAIRFEWIPPALTWENYPTIFQSFALGRWLGNSLGVILVAVPWTVLTGSLAGFALAALPARARTGLVVLSVAALLVPTMALWVPRFLIYKTIGILDTPLALIAPSIMGTSPLYVLLFAWAFARVPPATFEQARLDGAGPLRVWWSIGLPQVWPAIGAVTVLATVAYWSDYLSPLFYINNQDYYTLPVGIQALQQSNPTGWPLLMAGSVALTLPVLGIFLVAQRFFFRLGR